MITHKKKTNPTRNATQHVWYDTTPFVHCALASGCVCACAITNGLLDWPRAQTGHYIGTFGNASLCSTCGTVMETMAESCNQDAEDNDPGSTSLVYFSECPRCSKADPAEPVTAGALGHPLSNPREFSWSELESWRTCVPWASVGLHVFAGPDADSAVSLTATQRIFMLNPSVFSTFDGWAASEIRNRCPQIQSGIWKLVWTDATNTAQHDGSASPFANHWQWKPEAPGSGHIVDIYARAVLE